MLPIGPTGYADSPYQSLSTFAGNPQLISFDLLAREGLISRSRLARFPEFPSDHVDYGPVLQARMEVLHIACRSFDHQAAKSKRDGLSSISATSMRTGWMISRCSSP